MGNRSGICSGGAAQHCVDECSRLQIELDGKSRDADDPDCDPAGAVFNETLVGLNTLDNQALRFAGTSNLAAVRWLITMGCSLKARDKSGTTMLHAACRSGSLSVVQELLRRGLPLDSVDSAGWTSLHIAAVMGRREVSVLLLQARANAQLQTKRSKLALDVCSDPGTNEVIREFLNNGGDPGAMRIPGQTPGASMNRWLNGGAGQDDTVPTCEPFFVPRPPLFHDEEHRQELVHIGLSLFESSAGHGLAFFVAAGIVHDHPTDMSSFLVRHSADPGQLGVFLGEDFSLAQTLRLAFIHAVELQGTGVVSGLLKAFQHIKAPPDLQKIDRLTSGIAHLWWRTHDLEDCVDEESATDWALYSEDGQVKRQDKELCGLDLRRQIRSVEGLRRLMFSTVMLAWNMHADPSNFPGPSSPRRLSLAGWLDINSGLEADSTDLPAVVQKGVFENMSKHSSTTASATNIADLDHLLPDFSAKSQRSALAAPSNSRSKRLTDDVDSDVFSGRCETNLSLGSGVGSGAVRRALCVKDQTTTVRGWATIPKGGLERQDPAMPGGRPLLNLGTGGILSETSGLPGEHVDAPYAPSTHGSPGQEGETVYLTLRFNFMLFLSQSPNDTPYAFVRLRDVMLSEVLPNDRQISLVGKQKPPPDEDGFGGEFKPFGDGGRQPLPLCFLLADGRFQLFEAVWLEVQFKSGDDFELWSKTLTSACQCSPTVSFKVEDQAVAPRPRALGAQDNLARGGPGSMLRNLSCTPPLNGPGFQDNNVDEGRSTEGACRSPRATPGSFSQRQGSPAARIGPTLPPAMPQVPPLLAEDFEFGGPRPAG